MVFTFLIYKCTNASQILIRLLSQDLQNIQLHLHFRQEITIEKKGPYKNNPLILEDHLKANFWMFSIVKYFTNRSLTPFALNGTMNTESFRKIHPH